MILVTHLHTNVETRAACSACRASQMAEPADPERLVRMRAALEKFLGLIDHKATYVFCHSHAVPKTFRESCRKWTRLP